MRKPETGSQRSEIRSQRSVVGGQKADLRSLIEKAYSRGIAAHGDLGIALEDFAAHLNSIISKRLGANPEDAEALRFLAQLHTDDLYLTTACAYKSETAWNRLAETYDHYINTVAHSVCPTHQEARELASSLLAHLFFPDRQGHTRIASYDGRAPLRSWISAIMKHQAMNQHELKSNEALPLDSLRLTASAQDTSEIEAALTNSKFKDAIADSFNAAVENLSDQEKVVLVMYVKDQLTAAEIGRRSGVHKAQITRRIQRLEQKIGTLFFARLNANYKLNLKTIQECAACIVRSAESLFTMLHKTSV